MTMCKRCGENNPAEIHTCTPRQSEPEPVAWRYKIGDDYIVSIKKPNNVYIKGDGGTHIDNGEPLYTTPQKYCPSENNLAYERGFVDGTQKQIESAVHRAVTAMSTPTYYIPSKEKEWVGLTEEEMLKAEEGCSYMDAFELTLYAEKIEAILKEKNRG